MYGVWLCYNCNSSAIQSKLDLNNPDLLETSGVSLIFLPCLRLQMTNEIKKRIKTWIYEQVMILLINVRMTVAITLYEVTCSVVILASWKLVVFFF